MDDNGPVYVLSEAECLARLGFATMGRIAFSVGDAIEIFPINFHVRDRRLVFRTAPGLKLAGVTIASDVAIEIDEIEPGHAWSVVAHGKARRLELESEIAAAEKLPLHPLVPTVKREYVEVALDRVSGRGFRLDAEPEAQPETVS